MQMRFEQTLGLRRAADGSDDIAALHDLSRLHLKPFTEPAVARYGAVVMQHTHAYAPERIAVDRGHGAVSRTDDLRSKRRGNINAVMRLPDAGRAGFDQLARTTGKTGCSACAVVAAVSVWVDVVLLGCVKSAAAFSASSVTGSVCVSVHSVVIVQTVDAVVCAVVTWVVTDV